MQKYLAVALFLVISAIFISASPVPEERTEVEGHVRLPRFTCDVLSFGGQVNHSACAVHCLALGKKGGYCENGVCKCRK